MVVATSAMRKVEAALAATVFAIALIATAVRANAPLWRRSAPVSGVTPRDAVRQMTQLIMLAYLWCGLAFYGIYLGTKIHWQHGWEYGSAMLLIALAHALYLWRLSDPKDSVSAPRAVERAVRLASFQAVLIAGGLIWLVTSGKLASLRGDWPANQLFLAGGLTIACLSLILIKTSMVINSRKT
jgi:hypothetical protein